MAVFLKRIKTFCFILVLCVIGLTKSVAGHFQEKDKSLETALQKWDEGFAISAVQKSSSKNNPFLKTKIRKEKDSWGQTSMNRSEETEESKSYRLSKGTLQFGVADVHFITLGRLLYNMLTGQPQMQYASKPSPFGMKIIKVILDSLRNLIMNGLFPTTLSFTPKGG